MSILKNYFLTFYNKIFFGISWINNCSADFLRMYFFGPVLSFHMWSIYSLYYEQFLLVILCKFNLTRLGFAIASWFFCCLFCSCYVEVFFELIFRPAELFFVTCNTLGDFFSSFFNITPNTFVDPVSPKDLQVLVYELEVDSIETTHDYFNNIPSDTKKVTSVPRPYICACAFFILYLGVCISSSAG